MCSPLSADEVSTVLIVDDDTTFADMLGDWLSPRYDTLPTYTGEAALRTLDDTIDVVLLDRQMPDLSGDTVLDDIRAQELDCRVAMITGVEPDIDILELGFDEYLTKPVTREEVEDLVGTLLARKHHDTATQQYYRLVAKQVALEQSYGDDVTDHPEYHVLLEEIESLRSTLDDLTDDLTVEDLDAQFYNLTHEQDAETTCPACSRLTD